MISDAVKFALSDGSKPSSSKISVNEKFILLKYPCDVSTTCQPYELKISPGAYKFECWGAKGKMWQERTDRSFPGLGAYTKGNIIFEKNTILYIYVGATGLFNSVNRNNNGYFGGGATDVRLTKTNNWYDMESLISRIMVAAGGGGAEWNNSIGGNGGELEGGSSKPTYYNGEYFQFTCAGATQTQGSDCNTCQESIAHKGTFGMAGNIGYSSDAGGQGGGGYYGGTSYNKSYAGSGGSSFISGHPGCDAVKDNAEYIEHTGHPFHYSSLVFTGTQMIGGNKTMPLPDGSVGIFSEFDGAFRISLIEYKKCTCKGILSGKMILFFTIIVKQN